MRRESKATQAANGRAIRDSQPSGCRSLLQRYRPMSTRLGMTRTRTGLMTIRLLNGRRLTVFRQLSLRTPTAQRKPFLANHAAGGGGDIEIKGRWQGNDFMVERKVPGGGKVTE